ncbi:MAG: hypothetical protein ACREEM_02905 [Blastocatellia bacterium]
MEADRSTDQITKLLYKTLDSLLFEGPKTTGYGTLLGLIIFGLLKGFAPLIKQMAITQIFDVEKLPWFFYPALGVAMANSVSWVIRLVRKPMPPEIKTAFVLIEEAKRNGSLTADEVKERYLRVIDDYVEKLRESDQIKSQETALKRTGRKPARKM